MDEGVAVGGGLAVTVVFMRAVVCMTCVVRKRGSLPLGVSSQRDLPAINSSANDQSLMRVFSVDIIVIV